MAKTRVRYVRTAQTGIPWWGWAIGGTAALFLIGRSLQSSKDAQKSPVESFLDSLNPLKGVTDAVAAPVEALKSIVEAPSKLIDEARAFGVRTDVLPSAEFAFRNPALSLDIVKNNLFSQFTTNAQGQSIAPSGLYGFAAGFGPNAGGAGGFSTTPELQARVAARASAGQPLLMKTSGTPAATSTPTVSVARAPVVTVSSSGGGGGTLYTPARNYTPAPAKPVLNYTPAYFTPARR